MKHSNFKRFLCLVLAFCLILPYCVTGVNAAEEVITRIPHTQTEGDSNYFTFSPSGWDGGNENHAWSADTTANPESVWYTVNFVGHAIDVYAGKNWPMGYVAYYIDDEYVGEFDLYQSYNSDSLYITTIEVLRKASTSSRLSLPVRTAPAAETISMLPRSMSTMIPTSPPPSPWRKAASPWARALPGSCAIPSSPATPS